MTSEPDLHPLGPPLFSHFRLPPPVILHTRLELRTSPHFKRTIRPKVHVSYLDSRRILGAPDLPRKPGAIEVRSSFTAKSDFVQAAWTTRPPRIWSIMRRRRSVLKRNTRKIDMNFTVEAYPSVDVPYIHDISSSAALKVTNAKDLARASLVGFIPIPTKVEDVVSIVDPGLPFISSTQAPRMLPSRRLLASSQLRSWKRTFYYLCSFMLQCSYLHVPSLMRTFPRIPIPRAISVPVYNAFGTSSTAASASPANPIIATSSISLWSEFSFIFFLYEEPVSPDNNFWTLGLEAKAAATKD
ncbi:hypothetical protein CPB84DRAFT_1851052 [Gymnopilus junonius]|uniref:Uncharacterized protein n=1 Tax=Gymnopilus junonius TaxID=109634 RepID=A0A9P5NFF0_GYMJU|nr:hypothetical protein CPB84DRAFT_1851052 [Gymnopilus junonius]